MRMKTMNLDIKKECNNVMVIVPHQDDEILMSAGVIRVCEQNNVPYTVVMVTNGDYGCIDYSKGYARLKESLAGLETLGSNKESFEIMGYADTGMPERESFLTHLYNEKNEQKIYPSSCARETYGLEDKVEFHMKKYGKHGDYNRITFEKDLEMLLEEKKPDVIFTTSEYDMHGDHSGLYYFVCEVLDILNKKNGYEPKVFCGLIHSCAGDDNWPERDTAAFSCPQGLEENSNYKWEERMILELPEEMKKASGINNLKYLFEIRNKKNMELLHEIMRMVGLDPESKKKVKNFSLGMKQRLAIAQAIMEDPAVLILDEPMNGLDRQGVEEMRQIFCKEKQKGKTILLASHNREDIEALCDHVYEMEDGQIKQLR